ncbi:MAG: GNAT family N-acetyltransferase [Solibacillus sp.]
MNGTVVDPSLRGQDYGTKLLDEAAEYARIHHYKMEAICPFIVKKFEKTTAYDDLKV